MEKVGIITFHHAKHSYGAILQAYATLSMVRKLGFDAEIINYTNKYEQKELKFCQKGLKNNIYMIISWIARNYIYNGIKNPCRNKRKLNCLYKNISKRYRSIKELNKTEYSILISGSDQIWNPEVTGMLDEAFLLNFGNPYKKISYASSIGSYRFTSEENNILKKNLSNFDYLSVREQYAADALEKIYDGNIQVVCDPTLLLTGDEWEKLFFEEIQNKKETGKYILTYFVGANIDTYWERIEKFVNQKKLPVYNIQSHSKKYKHVDKAIYNIMPGDLVGYIRNADIVLTDSYHGTVFSINMKKNFVAVLNENNPVRVQNLLNELGLMNRIDERLDNCLEEVKYNDIEEKINKLRTASINWLIKALTNN